MVNVSGELFVPWQMDWLGVTLPERGTPKFSDWLVHSEELLDPPETDAYRAIFIVPGWVVLHGLYPIDAKGI